MVELYPETERFQQHRWLLNKSPAGAELSLSAHQPSYLIIRLAWKGNQRKENKLLGGPRSRGGVGVTGFPG